MGGKGVCAVLAGMLLAGASPAVSSDTPGAGTVRFELEIRERRLHWPDGVVRVSRGDRVELAWTTDEPVRLHLHGYDREFQVLPGEVAVESFEAHATGRFPITTHGFGEDNHGHETLLYLEVYPD